MGDSTRLMADADRDDALEADDIDLFLFDDEARYFACMPPPRRRLADR